MTVFHHYSKYDGFQLLLKFSFMTRNHLFEINWYKVLTAKFGRT